MRTDSIARLPARTHAGRAFVVVAALLLLVVAGWPHAGLGLVGWDVSLATSLNGNWTLAVPAARANELREHGIRGAVAGMPPLVDAVAARLLRDRTPLSPRLTFTIARDRIEARFGREVFVSAPGRPVRLPVPGDPSDTMELTQILRDGHLEQVFTTGQGRRWSTFTPSSDGERLTLDIVMRAPQLAHDLRFSLPYRRVR